jgi:FkbM family methyltransferase
MYHLNSSSNLNNTNNSDFFDMVEMFTLNHFTTMNDVGRCGIVKIDIGGNEYDILQGSWDLLKRHQPIFIVETNNDARIADFF